MLKFPFCVVQGQDSSETQQLDKMLAATQFIQDVAAVAQKVGQFFFG
jgi:hypothetical protein